LYKLQTPQKVDPALRLHVVNLPLTGVRITFMTYHRCSCVRFDSVWRHNTTHSNSTNHHEGLVLYV